MCSEIAREIHLVAKLGGFFRNNTMWTPLIHDSLFATPCTRDFLVEPTSHKRKF